MDKKPLTTQELKARKIPLPLNRGHKAEYYEQDGEVYCERSSKHLFQRLRFDGTAWVTVAMSTVGRVG